MNSKHILDAGDLSRILTVLGRRLSLESHLNRFNALKILDERKASWVKGHKLASSRFYRLMCSSNSHSGRRSNDNDHFLNPHPEFSLLRGGYENVSNVNYKPIANWSRAYLRIGSWWNPEMAMNATKESKESIEEALNGANIIFVIARMGGAPVIAEVAKSMGILTVGIVTTPFLFKGRRAIQGQEGIATLRENVNMLIVIPNDKLLTAISQFTPIIEAFNLANYIL
ncbi:hypothetical protein Cgig2_029901 [Carnegiea gigantea]|uniref:Tubulin/FtsZ GTPase domain-containing protein n=1 Tax=Carnegiea gigantea TaxID=171969 RepID=A0A9Q1GJ83_9CARY|nr:hypothetical protein Cgig2_029901 [Carnegiea gigantea]